jgi:MYXO-CTERM domain-containing protein
VRGNRGGFAYGRAHPRLRPNDASRASTASSTLCPRMTRSIIVALAIPTLLSATALAAEPGAHPYSHWTGEVRTISWAEIEAGRTLSTPVEQRDFAMLDAVAAGEVAADPDGTSPRAELPAGLVQRGGVVLPQAIDDGSIVIQPEDIFAVEDIPGNEYPRKHTLYLNFTGADLSSGSDNSAENKSQLARDGQYPAFGGGEARATSVAQGVTADFAPFGVRVVYLERPQSKTLPYTMAMVSGNWMDTNISDSAGGVAPGADCGALGQRHVVYAFETASAVQMANTTSQEAGHAYGLDHTVNCNSVMSYCGSGDQSFQSGCDTLCESACQGPNSAGCEVATHEMFCGEGGVAQDDVAEMAWIFGGNEPDMEDPTAEIVEPAEGTQLDAPADVDLRALVDDNYGGYGWKFVVEKDGEVIVDQVDYERQVDQEYRAALRLTQLPVGSYTFRIEVVDHYGGVGTDEVHFQVGEGSATGADDGDGDGGDDEGTDGGGDDDDDGGDEDDDDGDAGDGEGGQDGGDDRGSVDRGCAFTTESGTPWSAALFVLLVAGARRRRII